MSKTRPPSKRILYLKTSPLPAFAESALAITPKVYQTQAGLYLDLSATRKAYGSEEKQIEKCETLLDQFQLKVPLVVTDHLAFAQALCLKDRNIFPEGQSQAFLATLPIDTLLTIGNPQTLADEAKERAKLIVFMRRVGLYSISDFLKLPPTAINRRFGALGIEIRNYLNNEKDIPLPLFESEDRITLLVDTESHHLESLLSETKTLLTQCALRLEGRKEKISETKFTFTLDNRKKTTQVVRFSQSTRNPHDLVRVLKERFAEQHWEAPLQQLKIEITDLTKDNPGQLCLWDTQEQKQHDLDQFLSRLQATPGIESAGGAKLEDSYLPEKSWSVTWPLPAQAVQYPILQRPLFLFSNPKPWYPPPGASLQATENLVVEWWEKAISRQYFLAETAQEKVWVYWDGKSWYQHGVFD